MVQSLPRAIALEEFLMLPETKPASEYSDGQIVQKPMPQEKHSAIQTEFSTAINLELKPKKIAKAFSELRCTFGERSIVPDISVFSWTKIPRNERGEVANVFLIAPDWVVEVLSPELSPDQSQTRVTKNILHCLNHGTQVGWLIDPMEQTILVYLPKQQLQVFDRLDQTPSVPDFAEGLGLTTGGIFDWLLD